MTGDEGSRSSTIPVFQATQHTQGGNKLKLSQQILAFTIVALNLAVCGVLERERECGVRRRPLVKQFQDIYRSTMKLKILVKDQEKIRRS